MSTRRVRQGTSLANALPQAKESPMSNFERAYLVRQEQNKSLNQEAAFERWLASIAPREETQEPLGRRIVNQASAWLNSQSRSFPCTDTAPACGLLLAG
jgi:hypothetical protein